MHASTAPASDGQRPRAGVILSPLTLSFVELSIPLPVMDFALLTSSPSTHLALHPPPSLYVGLRAVRTLRILATRFPDNWGSVALRTNCFQSGDGL